MQQILHIGSRLSSYGIVNKRTDKAANRMADTAAKSDVKINIASTEGATVSAPESGVKLIGISLQSLSPISQFLLCCAGVFFFYVIYGYMQELLFQLEGFKPFGWYLTLIQFLMYTLFGLIDLHMKTDSHRRIPLKTYSFLAFLTVATMGLSNSSLGYLNYPTQVIFKCCKLVPVLIGGIIIQGKIYGCLDVTACICMSVGLIFFTLADVSVSPTFNLHGVILISLALCADAVIGNVQERVMKTYNASTSEMVLFSYSIGFIYILFGLVLKGELIPAFQFCSKFPLETYGYAFVFSLTGYLGVNIVLTMVKTFGALTTVTVTTCRKAVTMILSFMLFAKPFTIQYVWSGVIVLLGIYLNIYSKNSSKWNAQVAYFYRKYITGRRLEPQDGYVV